MDDQQQQAKGDGHSLLAELGRNQQLRCPDWGQHGPGQAQDGQQHDSSDHQRIGQSLTSHQQDQAQGGREGGQVKKLADHGGRSGSHLRQEFDELTHVLASEHQCYSLVVHPWPEVTHDGQSQAKDQQNPFS